MWDQMASSMAENHAGSDDMLDGSVIAILGVATKYDSGPTTKQKVYQRMFEHLALGDHTVVANLIVMKMAR